MTPVNHIWGEHLRPVDLPALSPAPLVSVLVANYNYGRFLAQALESVLGQTYKHYELVVCDDGSTDDSREILNDFASKHGQVKVVLQENKGQAEAILAAYQLSSGEILCFLDSDDTFDPTKLEEVVKAFLSAPEAGFLVHRLTAADISLRPTRPVPVTGRLVSGWKAPQMPLRSPQMLWGMPPGSGLAFRRAVAERIMPHVRGRKAYPDGVVQILAPLVTPIIAIDHSLGMYRVHGENSFALRKFTGSDLERFALRDEGLWLAWRSFVMALVPELPSTFPLPPEKAPSVVSYACARIKGEPVAELLYANVIASQQLDSMYLPHRWFWKSAAFLPDWLFEKGFNLIYGKSWVKEVVSHITLWLRARRAVAQLKTADLRKN